MGTPRMNEIYSRAGSLRIHEFAILARAIKKPRMVPKNMLTKEMSSVSQMPFMTNGNDAFASAGLNIYSK